MGLTRSQRHNKNMERIFRESEERGHKTLHGSTEKNHPRRMDARLSRIYGKGNPIPSEAKHRALKSRMGKKTRKEVEGMPEKHEPFTELKNRHGEFQ